MNHPLIMYLLGLEYAKHMIELDEELGTKDGLDYINKNIEDTKKIIEEEK